ncbi:NADH dehydrogenase [ubiquinone] 1 beta subcomplex subunit 8, mitochondrial [Ciona intestinalis]
MSILRVCGSVFQRIVGLSKVQRCAPSTSIVSKRFYDPDPTPKGYDQSLIEDDDLVCLLKSDEVLSPERRAKLAAKYGLIPEDYHPMNGDFYNLGDYPILPAESCLERDPYYDWDDPFYRRNWGEPISIDVDLYSPLVLDTRPLPYDPQQQRRVLFTFMFGFFFLWFLGEKYKSGLPRCPKQYPEHHIQDEIKTSSSADPFIKRGMEPIMKERQPVTHYTFEKFKWDASAH